MTMSLTPPPLVPGNQAKTAQIKVAAIKGRTQVQIPKKFPCQTKVLNSDPENSGSICNVLRPIQVPSRLPVP